MNIKAYIDQFDAIRHLPRDRQFVFLEMAQKAVEARFPISLFAIIEIVGPILSVGLIVGAIFLFSEASLLFIGVGIVAGLLLARVLVTELSTSLLRNALPDNIPPPEPDSERTDD